MNDHIPNACPECNAELRRVDTSITRGPTNTTGTLANKPSPNYVEVPAIRMVCDECEWSRKYQKEQQPPPGRPERPPETRPDPPARNPSRDE